MKETDARSCLLAKTCFTAVYKRSCISCKKMVSMQEIMTDYLNELCKILHACKILHSLNMQDLAYCLHARSCFMQDLANTFLSCMPDLAYQHMPPPSVQALATMWHPWSFGKSEPGLPGCKDILIFHPITTYIYCKLYRHNTICLCQGKVLM